MLKVESAVVIKDTEDNAFSISDIETLVHISHFLFKLNVHPLKLDDFDIHSCG